MSTNNSTINQTPYLRTSRTFPEESQPLSVELSRAYIDIAEKVNDRTIGIYPVGKPANTGDTWFVNKSKKQQSLRQVYTFTTFPANINHGINVASIGGFTAIYGTYTNGTNWFPIPLVNTAATANQVQIIVTPTQIQVTAGGGASASVSGFIVLEWLGQP